MDQATSRPSLPHGSRRLAALLLLASMLLAPWPVLAQTDPASVTVYQSAEFGYLFWWDTNGWVIDDHFTEPGADGMQLSSSESVVRILGFAQSGVTVESCLLAAIDSLQSDPELVRFEFVNELRGLPAIAMSADGRSAETELFLGFDAPTGQVKIAARLTCLAVVPDDFFLLISESTSAERYNATNASPYNQFGGDSLVTTLTLPRWVWPAEPGATWMDTLPLPLPQPVVTPDGQEVAILTFHAPDCVRHLGEYPWVMVIENTGVTSLEIGPDDFLSFYDGVARGPRFARWFSPPAESAQITVQPGETAVLHLQFDGNDDLLYYLDPWSNLVNVGSLLGCQGGVAAPVIVDME